MNANHFEPGINESNQKLHKVYAKFLLNNVAKLTCYLSKQNVSEVVKAKLPRY